MYTHYSIFYRRCPFLHQEGECDRDDTGREEGRKKEGGREEGEEGEEGGGRVGSA